MKKFWKWLWRMVKAVVAIAFVGILLYVAFGISWNSPQVQQDLQAVANQATTQQTTTTTTPPPVTPPVVVPLPGSGPIGPVPPAPPAPPDTSAEDLRSELKNPEPNMRLGALEFGLESFSSPGVPDEIASALVDEDQAVSEKAQRILEEKIATDALIKCLDSENENLRVKAGLCLKHIGLDAVVPLLKKMGNSVSFTREQVVLTLVILGRDADLGDQVKQKIQEEKDEATLRRDAKVKLACIQILEALK